MKCCPDYCESCLEHHSGDVGCPPHEVRATGMDWFRNRIKHLEDLLVIARQLPRGTDRVLTAEEIAVLIDHVRLEHLVASGGIIDAP